MGGEDHRRVGVGNFVELLDEDRALGLEALDHVAVVYDLVAHIDRRAVAGERPLDRVDGAHDAGAEAARRAQQHLERGLLAGAAGWACVTSVRRVRCVTRHGPMRWLCQASAVGPCLRCEHVQQVSAHSRERRIQHQGSGSPRDERESHAAQPLPRSARRDASVCGAPSQCTTGAKRDRQLRGGPPCSGTAPDRAKDRSPEQLGESLRRLDRIEPIALVDGGALERSSSGRHVAPDDREIARARSCRSSTPPIFWRTRMTILVSATARSPRNAHREGKM